MLDAQTQLLPLAIFLAMTAIGIELQWYQFRDVVKVPRVPVLGTLIHTFTFPLLAIAIVGAVLLFNLPASDTLLAGMLLIAACPSGGFSNVLVLAARANLVLSIVLTAGSSLLSFFTVPALMTLFGQLLPSVAGTANLPIGTTLLQLFLLVVLPVTVGMIWRQRFPDFVTPRIGSLQKWTQLLLYAVILIMLYQQADVFLPAVSEALPWAICLCFAVILLGYALAKAARLKSTDAVTVAIEGSVRNIGVAILIAATMLGRLDLAALPTVYFGAILLVGFMFARFCRARHERIRPEDVTGNPLGVG